MAIQIIICAMLLLSFVCVIAMVYKLRKQQSVSLSKSDYIKLSGSGIISFIADTLGIGSFAVNVAMAKLLGTFADDELPAVSNGAQVIPGVIESLFFMQIVDVDITTMLVLVIGTCIGGLIGGFVVSHLSKQAIRLTMCICFTGLVILLIGHQFNLMPVGGELTALHGWKLGLGFFAMIICGGVTSAGIGLFAMVQGVLFLLNVSPFVAFPIMTTAGAMQQPLTTMVFLQQNKIPLKKTLVLSLAGCVGVLFTLQIFSYLTASWLHSLLLFIVIYNLYAMGKAYLRHRQPYASSNARESIAS